VQRPAVKKTWLPAVVLLMWKVLTREGKCMALADYKIIAGIKPAELPTERPATFGLVINSKLRSRST
jgi:hypothetical protein